MVQPSDQVGRIPIIKATAESNLGGTVKVATGKETSILASPPFPTLNGAILVKLS